MKRSLTSYCFRLFCLFLSFTFSAFAAPVFAWEIVEAASVEAKASSDQPVFKPDAKYLGQITLHTVEELTQLLQRAEAYYANYGEKIESPVQLVLHGDEVQFFRKKNYAQYKSVIDLAATLDAFKVVDVRVCEQYMNAYGISEQELQPFVDTVESGMREVQRLRKADYSYF